MRLSFRGKDGFGLILMTILIAVTGALVGMSSWFFANQMRQTQLRIDETKAHYLAQAGVMRSIWNWYTTNTTVESSREAANVAATTIVGNNAFEARANATGTYLQSNMAYVTPTSHTGIVTTTVSVGNNQLKTVGTTTIGRTTTVAVPVGDMIVVYFAMDDVAGPISCADTKGNTYAIAAEVTNAGDVRTAIFYAYADTALASGDTVTVTHPAIIAPNLGARSLRVRSYRGPVMHLDQVLTNTGTGTALSIGNITPANKNSLIAVAFGIEGPLTDTFTVGASYTSMTDAGLSTGAADTNITIAPESRVVTTAGAYATNGTNSIARDWAGVAAVFYQGARWRTPPATANRQLTGWRLTNIHTTATSTITIDRMKVSWTGGGAAQLREVRLNNVSVWTGTAASGTTIDVTNTALAGNRAAWSGINTYLQWDNGGPADPVTVSVQFIFAGDSATTEDRTHEVRMWDGCQTAANCDGLGTPFGLPKERTYTVTASGQINQTTDNYFKVLKTVRATVSQAPGAGNNTLEIIDWDEGDKAIP